MLATVPRLDASTAATIARDYFDFAGVVTALPSERDQNFLVESPTGSRIVLKIANAGESRLMLDAQQAAMVHVGAHNQFVPRVIPANTGGTLVEVPHDGQRYLAWAIQWIDGVTLAAAPWRSPSLLEDFGVHIGRLAGALADFDHPGIHRDFYWDLANASRMVREQRASVTDPAVGAAIDAAMRQFNEHTAPLLPELRRAAIHGDLNDHNVLVRRDINIDLGNQRIAGFVDFGDMVHSYSVGDLAIAAAYMMLDADDPLSALCTMVRGYHREHPLDETELGALFGLSVVRLCASVCIAAIQQRDNPDNGYLAVSQRAIRDALPRLAATPFRVAEMLARDACGYPPTNAARATEWIASHGAKAAPLLGIDLRREPWMSADLGITSPWLSADPAENAEPAFSRRLFGAMREAGVRVAVGGYDEPRLLYIGPEFAGENDERRTVHLGVDLWADAGTPVFAPVEGVVHCLHDNAAAYDFGPVIILRHALDTESDLFTLYGHLSRESLTRVSIGQVVPAGLQIGTLGTPSVNGGWSPHLHFQIITALLGLDTDPSRLIGVGPTAHASSSPRSTLDQRRALFPRNVSVSYTEPLKVVRGWKQYLLDETGRKYLDAYNNVPHVGHCHPRVADAGIRQMRLLNTNTRYLSDSLNEYAARLTATLPDSLQVCVFVNSASEANELALRMARAHTRARDMVVLEAAYHGNTTTLIDLSPYKHAGPGGAGAPDWVHVAPLPDDYRGAFKRSDPEAGKKYAMQVGDIVQRAMASGRTLAGFIAETCPSVGGQILLPPGYLAAVYRTIRGAGGLCIADEVQTGLGRMGTHCWAFQAHDVVPDIVVMGKPLGNGHPIGAVVTTRAIADSFDTGMEFFSTFGGNNVSCAIGLAVLDVLRDEELQTHALKVGAQMRSSLEALSTRYPMIGDVRGTGLFLGVELVRDRETLEPAGAEASFVANRMREMGVLLGTDGPHHNVIKIRPPMPFDEQNADFLVDVFQSALKLLPS